MATDNIVIVGSGLGGYSLAREIRKLDRRVSVHLITRDEGSYYSKPMLSNSLSQRRNREQLTTSSAERMAEQLGIDIYANTPMLAIDSGNREILLKTPDGPEISLPYSSLVLALGADPIPPKLDGDGAGRVFSVNDLADYDRLQQQLVTPRRVIILGAGFVGLEFANDLLLAGHQVTVVDPGPHPLSRWLPREVGEYLQESLAASGLEWSLNCRADSVHLAGDGVRVGVSSGSDRAELEADLVVSAIGLAPRIDIARQAGLEIDRGILADEYLQTSVPGIYALGDCSQVEGRLLPFVMPLMAGARALAATLTGNPSPLDLPLMPITLKTPACPVVVLAEEGHTGEWQVEAVEEGIRALFFDRDDRLRGFALAGKAAAERSKLVRQVGGIRITAPAADPAAEATENTS